MANNDNIIYARFNHGHEITTDPRSQYAYGQVVKISGLHLPASFDADIANKGDKQAKGFIGTNNELPIDDNYFLSGKDIIIMINVHATDKDGRTKYIINIPIDKRSKRADIELEPVEQDVVSTAIATLNEAVERTSADIESAENSASRAHESAIDAETSATNASNSEALAQQYMERAETAAENSEKSETKAKASEESAKQSETHAEQIANDIEQFTERAETASRNAESSANIATEKAAEASESVNIASAKANEASTFATNAQNSADNAQQSATSAQTSANSASASASKALVNAEKTQSDKEIVELAKSNVLSAVGEAQTYATTAQSASQAIQDMNVQAITLGVDSNVTVEKSVDPATGAVTLTYGIPKGVKGDKGDTGSKGDKGDPFVYSDFTPEQLASLKGEKGDKGDKGDQGIQGEQGIQGIQGERGDKGDQGIQGVKGDTGVKGDKGDAFEYSDFTPEQLASLKGEKGDTGDSGVYVGTSAPSDENVNVWINPDANNSDVAIMVDAVPTQGSTNAVQSGGVYSLLADVNSDVADLNLRVEELEQGGSGGLSMTAVNLLNTILTEAVYGSDQTANIALLYKELSNVAPVSISAVLDGTALAGQSYSELSFVVTATFDDESTQVVDNYTIVTTGTVTAGSNTVTIRYSGITTTCTFTAEQVITYSITYNLTNVASSSNVSIVRENAYYNTVLSVAEGYAFGSCTVVMDGVDITSTAYNNMEILITEVTGNVVITASATEIVPISDVAHATIKTRVYSYSDNGQTTLRENYYGSELYYTKHNFRNASTVTVTIANNTENDITASVYAGEIPTNVDALSETSGQYYKPNLVNVELWNAKKVTPNSNVIPAGGSVVADIDVTAGRRIAVSLPKDMTSLDITMVGTYEPIDYSTIFDELVVTALGKPTTTGRTYYADAGTTVVKADVWGYEYCNQSYQWDTSKLYNIVRRFEPATESETILIDFMAGFGSAPRATSVYNCNSLSNTNHWKSNAGRALPFFDYIGTIQPLDGYPVYTTFSHNENCKTYVMEVTA